MSYDKKMVNVNVKVKKETPKAYLLTLTDNSEAWFPKSQISGIPNDKGFTNVQIAEWLLIQKNIIAGEVNSGESEYWKCQVCGTEVKKGFKYCKNCYRKFKEGEKAMSKTSKSGIAILCELIRRSKEDPNWDSSQNANLCRGECESGEHFDNDCEYYNLVWRRGEGGKEI